jgi:hypothetical protein
VNAPAKKIRHFFPPFFLFCKPMKIFRQNIYFFVSSVLAFKKMFFAAAAAAAADCGTGAV